MDRSDILPSRNIPRKRRRSSIKSQTIPNITRRHRRTWKSGEDLPLGRIGSIVGTSHEARGTESAGRVVAELCPRGESEWS